MFLSKIKKRLKMSVKTTEEMIEEKGLTAPRVTKALINSKIERQIMVSESTRGGKKIFLGMYIMKSGFTVIGTPVVANTQIGEEIDENLAPTIVTVKIREGKTLRFAYKEYKDGSIVIGRPSASVSPENDDREIGEKIAIENCLKNKENGHVIIPVSTKILYPRQIAEAAAKRAFDEIWAFEGYLLAHELSLPTQQQGEK